MTRPRLLAKIASLAFFALPAAAHEFWVQPLDYAVDVGEPIQGVLKNGDMFKGPTYPYLDEWFSRFEVIDRKGATPVIGRRGDSPALNFKTERGGLHIVAYASTMYSLTYANFEKFAFFVRSKKLDWVLDAHAARGLPDKVKETYSRYPKALVKVGSGAGRDRLVGMPFELVAEINPYSDAAKDGVRVRLYYEGEPYPGADVQIFHRPGDGEEVVKDHVTTDATGRAVIPAFDGGPFLINATMIREPRAEGAAKGAMWESLWASMTYEVEK